jgi:hypothetical protein
MQSGRNLSTFLRYMFPPLRGRSGGVVTDTAFNGWREIEFFSGCEGSQAVPARPSSKDRSERRESTGKWRR